MVSITIFQPLFQFVILSLLIISIAWCIKRKGVFDESYQSVFDKLVTELAVPAVIFSIFVTADLSKISASTLLAAGVLFIALLITLCIAYGFCRLMHFPPKKTGTLVMVSGFGSTATMGTPLLVELFGNQSGIIEQGITIGIFGMALPFFTLGPLIASYFGTKELGREAHLLNTLKEFLVTPIFISFIFGAIIAFCLKEYQIGGAELFIDFFDHFFTIINSSLILLIWIAIGLMIKPIKLRTFLPLLGIVVVIKMIIQPLMGIFFAELTNMSEITYGLLLLECAVPSGAIATVLSSRYGCDGSLAGWIVVGTFIISIITIPVTFFLAPI